MTNSRGLPPIARASLPSPATSKARPFFSPGKPRRRRKTTADERSWSCSIPRSACSGKNSNAVSRPSNPPCARSSPKTSSTSWLFNSEASPFAPTPQPATPDAVAKALDFVRAGQIARRHQPRCRLQGSVRPVCREQLHRAVERWRNDGRHHRPCKVRNFFRSILDEPSRRTGVLKSTPSRSATMRTSDSCAVLRHTAAFSSKSIPLSRSNSS